jgi:hypothetical protein
LTTRIDRRAVEYIAREAIRRYGEMEPRLPDKLRRNIRRNLGVSVPRDEVLRLAEHYKAAYGWAAAKLPKFTGPSLGKYAAVADIRVADFIRALRRQYPREAKVVIDTIAWYTIYYEHLR